MKKVYFPLLGILLLALTIVSSCKKENQEQLDQSDESALKKGSFNNDKHGCRLVADSGLSDGFLQTCLNLTYMTIQQPWNTMAGT
jgi:ABC-type Fe3+-citrate transport system substrate-binding protein